MPAQGSLLDGTNSDRVYLEACRAHMCLAFNCGKVGVTLNNHCGKVGVTLNHCGKVNHVTNCGKVLSVIANPVSYITVAGVCRTAGLVTRPCWLLVNGHNVYLIFETTPLLSH
jgi:hypothetical protein